MIANGLHTTLLSYHAAADGRKQRVVSEVVSGGYHGDIVPPAIDFLQEIVSRPSSTENNQTLPAGGIDSPQRFK